MRDAIDQMLSNIEAQRNVRVLYACESGSRAWGFASPDSDYDVRFIYRQPVANYLGVRDRPDTIDFFDGDLDASGWDLLKAAGLLGQSNGSILEWLRSPIVYRKHPGVQDRWQQTAQQFSRRALAHHYRGMAKSSYQKLIADDERRPKDYLYALRAILASRWVVERQTLPPVVFDDLLVLAPHDLEQTIDELLELKARSPEGYRRRPITVVDEFLQQSLAALEAEISNLPKEGPTEESLNELVYHELLPLRRGVDMETADFTVQRVRRRDLLLFDAVAGSHAYGTSLEDSDVDRRGIFVAPPGFLLAMDHIDQCSDQRSDQVYYELGRFFDLALQNNPNILELLAIPEDCIRYAHPLFERLKPRLFLSKQCARTFGQYAMGQIRKARGLNKKIVNPEPKQRKQAIHFCYVLQGQGSVPLTDWLQEQGLSADHFGLTSVSRAKGVFALFTGYDDLRGIFSDKDPDALVFSSVPRQATPQAWMAFNEQAFKAHCKAHREYWRWVEERNEERYATNAEHGRGYDSKNLMHTFRLLDMALDIARQGELRVRRPNREYLLRIRAGEFAYDDLLQRAEAKLAEVEEAFQASSLPEFPDPKRANALLVELREEFAG